MATYKVGYFVGSLSSTSINRLLAKALVRLASADRRRWKQLGYWTFGEKALSSALSGCIMLMRDLGIRGCSNLNLGDWK